MSSPPQPDRSDELRQIGNGWLTEVAELRKADVPDADAPPPVVHKALVAARGNLDRAEEIYSQAMALSSAARLRARELTEKADDDLDQKIRDHSSRARDFEASAERLANARLGNLELRRPARSAQKVADIAETIEKQVRLAYYGLSGLRDDLARRLVSVTRESSLDR